MTSLAQAVIDSGAVRQPEPSSIPLGYCHCGCGEKTKIIQETDRRHGLIKGQPRKYVYNHQGRGKPMPEWQKKMLSDMRWGSGNPMWKGNQAGEGSARERAHRRYELKECERCGRKATDRHHKDGNPWNNVRSNISLLCRRCHMTIDGRIEALVKFGKEGRNNPQKGSARYNAVINEEIAADIKRRLRAGEKSIRIAEHFNIKR